ncbi:FtsX-like permease family protein [Actinoplanes sp. NPDC004185]
MLKLTVQMLRRRVGAVTATLIALTVGVMILMSVGTLVESGLRYQPEPQRYAAADAVVADLETSFTAKGPDGSAETSAVPLPEGGTLPAALADQVRQIPGVASAVTDVSFSVVPLATPSVAASGHGWASAVLTPYRLIAGAAPDAAGEIVLDARLAGALKPGATTQVLVGGSARSYTVSGIAQADDTGGPAAVFFTDKHATSLYPHPGRVAAVGVLIAPGADRAAVTAALRKPAGDAGGEVYTGTDRGKLEASEEIAAKGLLLQVGFIFGLYMALIVLLVVAGTVGLSVRHRRRDLALLRAIAATPGQIRRIIIGEAAVLGVIAVALGIPAGILATGWTHDELVNRGFLPSSFPMHGGLLAALAVAAATVLVATGSALIAALRVARIRPTEALGEIAVERRRSGKVRLVAGLATLAGAAFMTTVSTATNGQTAISAALGMLCLFVLAVALLGPWVNLAAARLLGPVLRRVWGASGHLAAANLRANAQGMVTVLTALVLSVGFGGSVWFLQDNLQRQAVTQSRDGMLAQDAVMSATGLPDEAITAVRRIPGVQAATGVRSTSVLVTTLGAGEAISAQGVDPQAVTQTMDLRVSEGALADLNDTSVAVSTLQASTHGWNVGDRIKLWLGDGTPVEPTVAAIYERGWGFADVTLSRSMVTGHTASNLDDQILVRSRPGADVAAPLAALTEQFPGTGIIDTKTLSGQIAKDIAVSAWLNKLLIGVLISYAALAAANTMVLAALARGRELALLRLVGVTGRQVKRMVHAEQIGLLGTSLLIGGAAAAVTLVSVVNVMTGNPVPYVPPMGWVAVIGGTTLLALLTTVLPVGRLLRIPPVQNIGLRE